MPSHGLAGRAGGAVGVVGEGGTGGAVGVVGAAGGSAVGVAGAGPRAPGPPAPGPRAPGPGHRWPGFAKPSERSAELLGLDRTRRLRRTRGLVRRRPSTEPGKLGPNLVDRDVRALVQEPLALELAACLGELAARSRNLAAGVPNIVAGVRKLAAGFRELALERRRAQFAIPADRVALDHHQLERQRRCVDRRGRPDGRRRGWARRRRPGMRELGGDQSRAGVVEAGIRRLRLRGVRHRDARRNRGLRSIRVHRLRRHRWRPLGQATLGDRPPRHRGGGQMLGLVDRPAHPGQLPLEVGDVVMQRPEVARRGARLLGQRLLDLDAPRSLGVDVLLCASELPLALDDHVPQAVGLLACAPKLVLDLPDAIVEGDQRRLRFGRAPARALGRELGAAQLPGLEQLRPGTFGGTGRFGGAGFLDRPRHLPHRQRHHHGPQLEERLARQLRRKLRRDRECHPPGTRRCARQRRRLGHRHESLTDRAGLDHEHRLAAELGTAAAPPAGDANGDAAPAFGHELHRLDPQGGRQIAHRAGRYGRERTNPHHRERTSRSSERQ